ncbi:MAG: addiction module protein, partial [Planctomycetia bacterium]|nr:addiction module protein [Planctomycetia bacterium]
MIQPGKTYHLDQMSIDEKVDLVHDLWDSLSALPKSEAPTAIDEVAMRAEARRLLDEKIISIE